MSFAKKFSEYESNHADVDGLKSPISKRFEKNLICQRKVNEFSDIYCENRSGLFRVGKTDRRTELRLHRLSQKKYSMNEKPNEYNGSINEDWGRRTELHNLFHMNDGHKVWNIIRRGIFGEIKFWKSAYGSINCKATGKISVKGVSEKSLLEINTENNLRKLLNLSPTQWSALREAVDEKNIILSFNAFDVVDLNKLCSIGKLWYFICKRRHFLPNVCVMGKLSGAVKLMKEFQIVPKIVVTEIRDFKGDEIC